MQYSSQTGWWSVAIGKSIEWLCMEDCMSFCKTQQVVGFDCAGIERLSVPQPNYCLLLGKPICIVFLQRFLRLVVGRHTQLP